jgi:NAD(P)-dependent dehydrogenase (short-subunit alcohol dehydrogenase family)
MTGTVVVIGASGDVGSGIATVLAAAGWRVIIVGRDPVKLVERRATLPADGDIVSIGGSVANDEDAAALVAKVTVVSVPDVVIVTVNGPHSTVEVADLTAGTSARVFAANLNPHLVAARAFLPVMPAGGVFLGIGGGMADFVFPGMTAVSMAQAAQRVFYRYLAASKLAEERHVRELILASMIAGRRTAAIAEPHWVTAEEVGRHVLAVLGDLSAFEGPVLTLKSRKQVGLPERRPG